MKKIFVAIITFYLLSINPVFATNFSQYLSSDYIGMTYSQAVNQNKPFILVFASSKNLSSIVKVMSMGKFIYNSFKDTYNFSVLNIESKINNETVSKFNVSNFNLPVAFVVDPVLDQQFKISESCYNDEKTLNKILFSYLIFRKNFLSI